MLPWYSHFSIAAEDAVAIERPDQHALKNDQWPTIGVIRLPHVSNFDEFDPLADTQGVNLAFLEQPRNLDTFAAVILPGSKSTRSDLQWLQMTGWSQALDAYADKGGHILGICGGFQILGQWVHDPDGVEGPPGSSKGLGLLSVETELKAPKTTTRTGFSWQSVDGCGYEIHMGQTRRLAGKALFTITSRNQSDCADSDGCINPAGNVMGTYIHGIFDTPEITGQWLAQIGLTQVSAAACRGPAARDAAYDQLAAHMTHHIDIDRVQECLGK